MKILQINNTDLPGARFNGYNLLQDFNKKGIWVKQLVYEKYSDNENVISFADSINTLGIYAGFEKKISVHGLVYPYGHKIVAMDEFKAADVVHYHLIHNRIVSLYDFPMMAAKKRSVWTLHDPWVFTGHCIHPMECSKYLTGCNNCEHLERNFPLSEDKSNLLWEIKKEVYRKIDIDIVVASNWMKNLTEKSPLTKHFKRIHVIPFGINLDKYYCDVIRKRQARKKLNIPDDRIALFFRADNSEFKGLKYIKKMLEMLSTDKKLTLLTVGEKGLLNKYRLKYQIKDYGWIHDEAEIADVYAAADIFLMPSTAEAFGVMAIEAMATGIPVIVMEGTALPDVVNAPKCGIAFAKDDVNEFTAIVKRLIENESERVNRGKCSRAFAEKNYDENVYFNKMLKLYSEIGER
jgi:glycosyltransferase involved in cell wall biosynthesis